MTEPFEMDFVEHANPAKKPSVDTPEAEAAWADTAGAMEALQAAVEEGRTRGEVDAAEDPPGKIRAVAGEAAEPALAAVHGEALAPRAALVAVTAAAKVALAEWEGR